jgi:hypothetical protein
MIGNNMKRLNKKHLLFILSLVAGLCVFVNIRSHEVAAATGNCMMQTLQSSISPDKLWGFTIIDGECDSDYTWATDDVYRVIVTSQKDPTKTEWVYQIDVEADGLTKPVVSWSKQHNLNISTLKSDPGYYTVNPPAFNDVPINITYR